MRKFKSKNTAPKGSMQYTGSYQLQVPVSVGTLTLLAVVTGWIYACAASAFGG